MKQAFKICMHVQHNDVAAKVYGTESIAHVCIDMCIVEPCGASGLGLYPTTRWTHSVSTFMSLSVVA